MMHDALVQSIQTLEEFLPMELPNKLLANDRVGDSEFRPNSELAQQLNDRNESLPDGQSGEKFPETTAVRIWSDQLAKIDDWRGARRPIPSRNAAVRELIDLALRPTPVVLEDL
jgi:hypothetical protein